MAELNPPLRELIRLIMENVARREMERLNATPTADQLTNPEKVDPGPA